MVKTKGYDEDTIAAIATPLGEGAIAVVRLSGSAAISTADKVFRGKCRLADAASHTAHYGIWVDEHGNHVDEVVATVFRSPNSYTGEDAVEISCHGGLFVTQKVLQAVLRAGARQALPGEFTKRAFLHGRIDLSQAEAVALLIASRSDAAHRASLSHLEGKFSHRIRQLRSDLVNLSSMLELELDFSEEGIVLLSRSELVSRIEYVRSQLREMADSYRLGRVYRDGASVVIVGKPNVGKSSLFNALLRENRAIVTPIPGTTRDILEESISINGILFRLNDTAGLRETEDQVEQEGVQRTKELIRRADLLVLVADATTGASAADPVEFPSSIEIPRRLVIAWNKVDLLDDAVRIRTGEKRLNGVRAVELSVSAKTGYGLEELRLSIAELVVEGNNEAGGIQLISSRHHQSVLKAIECLTKALSGVHEGRSSEFLALDVREASDSLAEIIGDVTSDEILNNIFEKFCIGK